MKGRSERAPKTNLVLGCKPWNRRLFDEVLCSLPGQWKYIGAPEELLLEQVEKISPRYIFLLHWSWRVPDEIVERFEAQAAGRADAAGDRLQGGQARFAGKKQCAARLGDGEFAQEWRTAGQRDQQVGRERGFQRFKRAEDAARPPARRGSGSASRTVPN